MPLLDAVGTLRFLKLCVRPDTGFLCRFRHARTRVSFQGPGLPSMAVTQTRRCQYQDEHHVRADSDMSVRVIMRLVVYDRYDQNEDDADVDNASDSDENEHSGDNVAARESADTGATASEDHNHDHASVVVCDDDADKDADADSDAHDILTLMLMLKLMLMWLSSHLPPMAFSREWWSLAPSLFSC